jgi:hypothetical protein
MSFDIQSFVFDIHRDQLSAVKMSYYVSVHHHNSPNSIPARVTVFTSSRYIRARLGPSSLTTTFAPITLVASKVVENLRSNLLFKFLGHGPYSDHSGQSYTCFCILVILCPMVTLAGHISCSNSITTGSLFILITDSDSPANST